MFKPQPYSLTSLQSLMTHRIIFKVEITAINIRQNIILYCRTFSLYYPSFLSLNKCDIAQLQQSHKYIQSQLCPASVTSDQVKFQGCSH